MLLACQAAVMADEVWICAGCGAEYEEKNPPCLQCAGEQFAKLEDADTRRIEGTIDVEYKCRDCGATHPRNAPPCDECGGMDFETVREDPAEDDADGGGWLSGVFGSEDETDEWESDPSSARWSVWHPGGPFRQIRGWVWKGVGYSLVAVIAIEVLLALGGGGAGTLALLYFVYVFPELLALYGLLWVADIVLGYLKEA